MDIALITGNASQLRYVLHTRGIHPYYSLSLSMIGVSLLIQIAVGFALIWNGRYNVKVIGESRKVNIFDNWIVLAVFILTVLNIFISIFSLPDWNDIIKKNWKNFCEWKNNNKLFICKCVRNVSVCNYKLFI